jgi:hypothetical protein
MAGQSVVSWREWDAADHALPPDVGCYTQLMNVMHVAIGHTGGLVHMQKEDQRQCGNVRLKRTGNTMKMSKQNPIIFILSCCYGKIGTMGARNFAENGLSD